MAKLSKVATARPGFSAISTPAAVATPLPPFRPKNTGYRWPRKAASPAKAAVPSPSPQRGPNTSTSSTGTKPFKASSASVASAAGLLPERSTFVAPGLPEP